MFRKLIHFFHRKPDFIIGSLDNPYLLRWYIIPRNRFFNIYLHKFCRSDDDRALHDHPWPSCSFIIKGGYFEHLPNKVVKFRKPKRLYFRKATSAHRVELITDMIAPDDINGRFKYFLVPAWTLFFTGPKIREWGFHCPQGWRHWREFCDVREGEAKGNEIGRGCA